MVFCSGLAKLTRYLPDMPVHAIKPLAKLRHVFGGQGTPKSIHDYLVLLSVEETCKYRGISFLDFLRSGELNIDKFSAGDRSRRKVRGSLIMGQEQLP